MTGSAALLNLFSGPTGALSTASGQLFIEMSTAGPDVVQELAASLRNTGSSLIDAPVLGSPAVVTAGGAAILVGGAPPDMERGRQVLEMLGEVRLVGPLGSGARLKLIGNSMLATLTLAAAELQVAGEAAGLDPNQVFWALARLALDLFSQTRSQTPLTATVQSLIGEIGPSVGELDITAVISRYDGTVALSPAPD
ncbi:MAG: NAD(P)-binding domain-containing protein [Candidatus Dormibacteria bacterium]